MRRRCHILAYPKKDRLVSQELVAVKLAGGENDWRIRVGDYRVIYEIAEEIRVVRVSHVRHRREVYR
jgi:mRNA-degrading endonuclease RelE of RelBE toxin-antitoxin system